MEVHWVYCIAVDSSPNCSSSGTANVAGERNAAAMSQPMPARSTPISAGMSWRTSERENLAATATGEREGASSRASCSSYRSSAHSATIATQSTAPMRSGRELTRRYMRWSSKERS